MIINFQLSDFPRIVSLTTSRSVLKSLVIPFYSRGVWVSGGRSFKDVPLSLPVTADKVFLVQSMSVLRERPLSQ